MQEFCPAASPAARLAAGPSSSAGAGRPANEQLSFLTQHYPVVEVDATFYRSPARKTVEGWRDRTPPGFGFSLKVPQSITHEKMLLDCQGEVDAFLSAARLLGDKLLCCCLQFAYFNRGKFSSLNAFLDRLDPFLAAWPADVPLGGVCPADRVLDRRISIAPIRSTVWLLAE